MFFAIQQTDKIRLPEWLISGPVIWILLAILLISILMLWINFHLKRIQKNLHELGKSYYKKEQEILGELKAGLISEEEYRKRHERLLSEMREESRRLTD